MSTGELSGLAWLDALALQPVVLQTFNLQVSGVTLLLILMAIGAYIGWFRGVRAILTMALFSIIAYLVCVTGGDQVVGVINRLYTNSPRLAAFAIGRDPATVAPLDPLIDPGFQVPLFFRFVLFIALILLGWFFGKRAPWWGTPVGHEPLARPLGIFAGALIALLWSSALSIFWQEYLVAGGAAIEPLNAALTILPDVRIFIPSLITIFFIVLIGIIFISFPRLLAVPPPPKK